MLQDGKKKTKPDYEDLNLLEDIEALEVIQASLQLKVRHKCGTAHAYALDFDVDDEKDLVDQLNEDLSILVDLMQERVHEGEIRVNDRIYLATEITYVKDPLMESLLNKFPVMVLPPKTKVKPIESDKDKSDKPELSLKEQNDVFEKEDMVLFERAESREAQTNDVVYPDIQSEGVDELRVQPQIEQSVVKSRKRNKRSK